MINPTNSKEASKRAVICFHLLNDLSGSPMVLSLVIRSLLERGYSVELFTSKSESKGFLSDISGLKSSYFFYKRHTNKFIQFIILILGQIQLIWLLKKYRGTGAFFYVNTLLPFGAAIAGRLYGLKVIYHLHETSLRPRFFKSFLFWIASHTASHSIFVSNYLMNNEPKTGGIKHMIYNALDDHFVERAQASSPAYVKPFSVLMVCSLKGYKGVDEFVTLAHSMPDFNFQLVLNATQLELEEWISRQSISPNLAISGPQKDIHSFYSGAHLLLNLSHPNKWIETFGLTALEAMAYGIPVIVPACGGIAELVQDGCEGYKCCVTALEDISRRIREITSSESIYSAFSQSARQRSKDFMRENMIEKIEAILLAP